MRLALLSLLLLLAVAGTAFAVRGGLIFIPPDWNPWARLDVDAEPNGLTSFKLSRLSQDTELCRQVLATTGIEYRPLPDRTTGPACGFFNAVRIERTASRIETPFYLSCRAAVSFALWERHVVMPAAEAHFGQPVAAIEHFGSYSCRNVYGRSNATRSQHATAEALDVAGFVLADGHRIRVLKHWGTRGPDGTFLKEVRSGACRFFDGVLSPEYNSAHRDHLHFDRGPYRVCR